MKKKINLAFLFFTTSTLLSFFLLSLNSVFYPTLTIKYFKVSSLAIVSLYFIINSLCLLRNKKIVPDIIGKINNKVTLWGFLTTSILLIVLEKNQYPNFVLKYFHLFPYSFAFLALLSLFIFYFSSFRTKESLERKAKIFFPIIGIIFYYLWVDHHLFFLEIIEEDSLLEYLQFIFYLLAAIGTFKIFKVIKKDTKKKVVANLFLLLSFALFFISFEKISWGQRIIGFRTPETIKELNIQEETNIHNLFGYNVNQIAYVLIGLYGLLAETIVDKFLIKDKKKLKIFIPAKYLKIYFLALFLIYFDRSFFNLYYDTVVDNVFRKYAIYQWQEIGELYLAIAFFFFGRAKLREVKAKK